MKDRRQRGTAAAVRYQELDERARDETSDRAGEHCAQVEVPIEEAGGADSTAAALGRISLHGEPATGHVNRKQRLQLDGGPRQQRRLGACKPAHRSTGARGVSCCRGSALGKELESALARHWTQRATARVEREAPDSKDTATFLRRARAASLKAMGSRFGAVAEEEYDKLAPVIACTLPARTPYPKEREGSSQER